MKKLLLFLPIFGLFITSVRSQSGSSSDFMVSGRNSIGVNLYPIVANLAAKDTLLPFEVVYKRQTKSSKRAWRIGLWAHYSYDDSFEWFEDHDEPNDWSTTKKSFSVGSFIGHEWQTTLGKRWLLAYGSDIGYLYRFQEIDKKRIDLFDYRYRMWHPEKWHHLSLHTFLDINFAITEHLIVSTGFRFQFSYIKYKSNPDFWYERTSESSTTWVGQKDQDIFELGLSPFQQINIIYSF